eukprot:TRINITY_DN2074_c0_g1_i1.p1 TRINITY_DN2074_c0_g1~~TRINITY_DN2074_c0_g1_i1.p1  ORF type:complete len:629 (-),score=113.50 TRINITY_DN2074_c0_g1_i1:324-2210(-)
MELSVLDTCGLPDGSILSVRSGPTRRQSPMPCTVPFRLPAGPWPLRIDVLSPLGRSAHGASLAKLDVNGRCRIPLEARDGRQMSVTLQVFDSKGADARRPKTAPNPSGPKRDLDEPEAEASPNSPVRRRDTEAEARAYLDRHRLHEFMHELFELLLRERPADPYSFIAVRFREAALQEPCVGISRELAPPVPMIRDEALLKPHALAAPDAAQEAPSMVIPAGEVQFTVRCMRGRTLMRLLAKPSDTVVSVKEKIAASLGVPVAAQQLLWWAETLPNETTFEDHHMTGNMVTINLVCCTRDPRLSKSLSGASDGGLKVYNLADGEMLHDLHTGYAERSTVLAVNAHWESMRALSGCCDGRVQLWDLQVGGKGCLATLHGSDGHTAEVSHIEADWPSMRAVTAAADGTAKLWDLEARDCVRTFHVSSQGRGLARCLFFSICVDWAKGRVFGGLSNGLLQIWDLGSGESLAEVSEGKVAAEAANSSAASVIVDPAAGRAVSGLEDGHMLYWHFNVPGEASHVGRSLPGSKTWLAHYSATRSIVVKWVETDSRALVGSDDGSLSLWRLDVQACIARFARHVGMVWTLCVDWSLGRAMSGAFDGCVKLWDLKTGECLRTMQAHSRPVRAIASG